MTLCQKCILNIYYLEHIDEIVHIIFQYINMLRSSKPDEKIFLEMKDIKDMNFRFEGRFIFILSCLC